MDDIVITRSDSKGISSLKSFLQSQFHTKNLEMLRYFLSIEVMRSKHEIFLSQMKYVLDLLSETRKLGVKPCNFLMAPRVQLTREDETFEDHKRYRRLVGKLNYLSVTRPDIAHSVSVVSQYMSAPTINHWTTVEQIICYLKGDSGLGILYSNHGHNKIECFSNADWARSKVDWRSTSGYCVFVGGNLVSSPTPTASTLDPVSNNDLSIALRKGKHQCVHPISSFCSYNRLSSHSCSFIASMDYISLPKTVCEALSHPGWRSAMVEEM